MCVCVRVCVCAWSRTADSVRAWEGTGQENGQQDSRRHGQRERLYKGQQEGRRAGQRETVTDRREGDGEHGDRDSRTGAGA